MPEQWVITDGDYISSPVGPFESASEADRYYRTNKPKGLRYLSAPTIERLLRPAHSDRKDQAHECNSGFCKGSLRPVEAADSGRFEQS